MQTKKNLWITGNTGMGKSYTLRKIFDGDLGPAHNPKTVYVVLEPKAIEFRDVALPNVKILHPIPTDLTTSLDNMSTDKEIRVFVDDWWISGDTHGIDYIKNWLHEKTENHNFKFFVSSQERVIDTTLFEEMCLS